MRMIWKGLTAAAILATTVIGGALVVQISNPANNAEAKRMGAILVASTAACHAPEKTVMSASAEGLVAGQRKSVPLHVFALSTPGVYGVKREWPEQGTWAIKVVATNPEYKDFAASVLVPVNGGSPAFDAAKRSPHSPTETEIVAILGGQSVAVARQ